MMRGQEETSTSGRPGGHTRATPSASSIISSLAIEELMAYCEVPDNINLRLMDRTDESTLGGEHKGAPRSWATFPHSIPGQAIFAFYTGAPGSYPSQRHSYFDQVLRVAPYIPTRSLVGRDLYNLFSENKAGQPDVHVGSKLRLQVVNGLPDSPKTKVKGVLLVREPWDETLGSPGLPFDINRSQSFPGVWSG